jgi:hypothetical protein
MLVVGWGKPTRTLVPWRQGFRHPTRKECMGWIAQILVMHLYIGREEIDMHLEIEELEYFTPVYC